MFVNLGAVLKLSLGLSLALNDIDPDTKPAASRHQLKMGPENHQQMPGEQQEQAFSHQVYPPQAFPQQSYPPQDPPSHGFSQQGYSQQDFTHYTIPQQAYQPQVYPAQSFSPQSISPPPRQAISPQTYPAQSYPGEAHPPQIISPQAVSPQSPTSPPQRFETISQQHGPWVDPLSPDLRDSSAFDRNNDNQRGLIGNAPANVVDPKSLNVGVFDRSTSTSLPEPTSWWLRVFKSKWSMIACLVIGFVGALGHHLLYYHLDNRLATNQQWWLRLGQLISFIAKANFVVASIMAHQQIAWRAVGQKGFSVEAVDSLFGSAHNVTELFNREAWAKSWFVMFLALYMWASPFVVIFTSATLDVVPHQKNETHRCPSVRTLNFEGEVKKSFREPIKADGELMTGLSLSSYNWTYEGGNLAKASREKYDIFEYFTGPSPSLERIFSIVFSRDEPTQRENVAKEICGEGWDCSTQIQFIGPGYKCQELAKGVGSKPKDFGDSVRPENLTTDLFVPDGNYTYFSDVFRGEYVSEQMTNITKGGIPPVDPPYPDNLGAIRTEPIIWIGYSSVKDLGVPHARNRSAKGWTSDYEPTIFACEHWEVNYTVKLDYTSGVQTHRVTNRDYKNKIIDTVFEKEEKEPTDGTLDKNIITPETNYVMPRRVYAEYRRIAAYHNIGLLFRRQLQGNVQLPETGPTADGGITKTRLLDRFETLLLPNFHDKIVRAYEDLLISLLSDGQLLAVAWAADPSKLSGTGVGGDDTGYDCERRRVANHFDYEWRVLVAVYSVSFIIATIGVYHGISAMRSDGTNTQREMTFSSIAGATKRVSVDENERRETKIRCFPVDERSGGRLYEFRAELQG
ncbi:hypothetical protein N0V84_007781 [Fusarium piperis]|uniref:Uncharacterized protein n=1 Tax=Fusarium piperis TaxID=1435070 RepID=A0A9W8W9D3_9HYPO|nr:hypothetical protein N0V84_007781 [Fusarium piperis]